MFFLEIEITAQPRQCSKHQRLAEEIPYFSPFWKNKEEINLCYICGTSQAPIGQICKYCQSQFPIKKIVSQ